MSYRPDIDGLRAVAVLSVLFYHAHLGFPGGYVGVDVFFVISGFLITGLLLKAIRKGTFSYIDFWERRVRRLIPALAVVTLFTAVAGYFILLPEDLSDLGGALIAQPLLLSNVYFWRVVKGGYFGDPPEIRPLLHTWSLGVEEQFYVLFPLLLVLILKRQFLARHVGKILIGLTVASFGLAVTLTPVKSVFSFFNLPTRAWELLLGGLLALKSANQLSHNPPPRVLRELAALFGLGLVAYSIAFYHHHTPFPGYAALAPCLGTACLIWANSHSSSTFVGKVFSQPLMVRTGQISYSLYLWHWPLIAYGDYLFLLQSTEARWLVVGLSCLLGFISWRWIETPFREKKFLTSRSAILGLFIVYAMSCLCLGAWLRSLEVHPSRYPKPTRSHTFNANVEGESGDLPRLGSKSSPSSFLLWGDSHAMALAPLLNSLGAEHQVSGIQLTSSSKAPLLNWDYVRSEKSAPVSAEFKNRWAKLALDTAAEKNLRVVFLVGSWKGYSRPQFPQELNLTIQEFNRRGTRVVFICDNPVQTVDPQRQIRFAEQWNWPLTPTQEQAHRETNSVVYRAIENLSPQTDVTVIDIAPPILAYNSFLSEDGQGLYYDNNHLSDAGAMKLRLLFEPVFEDLAQGSTQEASKLEPRAPSRTTNP